MKQYVLAIVILGLTAQACIGAIVVNKKSQPEMITRLYEAAIDVLMTCYGDPSKVIGVVGDSNSSILKTLRSNYSVSVVLTDTERKIANRLTLHSLYKLEVFIVGAESPEQFVAILTDLAKTCWWNHYASFLVLNTTPETENQCARIDEYLHAAYRQFGVLNAQFMCFDLESTNVLIFNSNPFIRRAPESWKFFRAYEKAEAPFSVFKRIYQEGKQSCKDLNFAKTIDTGGHEFLIFLLPAATYMSNSVKRKKNPTLKKKNDTPSLKFGRKLLHIFRSIQDGLNTTITITRNITNSSVGMHCNPVILVGSTLGGYEITYPFFKIPLIAMSQHTPHMTQLKKILSVIDFYSRIGLCLVYLITFFFFICFIGLPPMPALLNLVRLTCNTGLTTLPRKFASTVYITALLIFVVNLQAIFTGNLATLLTTTIAYPNVNTKQDLADLGYTVYTTFPQAIGDDVPAGRVVEISIIEPCYPYVLSDPLAACVITEYEALNGAVDYNLHLSRDAIINNYFTFLLTDNNPFGRRIDASFSAMLESGNTDSRQMKITHKDWADFADDDEVKENKVRKVMTQRDLKFAFVILGVGLTCSLICFIVEKVIFLICVRNTKQKSTDQPARLAWH